MASDDGLIGKACVVTGANSGIGKEIARGLAHRGATVVMVARDRERGETARAEIVHDTGNDAVSLLLCDLSSQLQVRGLAAALVEKHRALHLLVNNAGLVLGERRLTEDGIESTFAINHLAPFLLTSLLLKTLEAAAPSRVVTVASEAHRGAEIAFDDLSAERGYSSWRAYAQSKLANILFTRELARRLEGTGVTAACVHPGVVRTGFAREGNPLLRFWFKAVGLFLLSPERGADTALWLATVPERTISSGGYYIRRTLTQPSRAARDPEAARRLWEVSARLCGVETS